MKTALADRWTLQGGSKGVERGKQGGAVGLKPVIIGYDPINFEYNTLGKSRHC